MEDLREVGQKAIESVNKLGASDAGDLVLGIGEIIEELRGRPEFYQDKLNHLEGLFREFVYGEGYQLRNNRGVRRQDDDTVDDIFNRINSPDVGSGILLTRPLSISVPLSGTFLNNSYQSPIKNPQTLPPMRYYHEEYPLPLAPVLQDAPKKKPKKFKKKWWNKQI